MLQILRVTQIISPLSCHLRFSIVVLETFKFKKKGLAMWNGPLSGAMLNGFKLLRVDGP